MKRSLYFPGALALCLAIGLLVGVLLPVDFQEDSKPAVPGNVPSSFTTLPGVSQPEGSGAASSAADAAGLDPADNFPLLGAACAVNRCLQQQNWASLSAYVHPDRGVTFTPYSTVDPDSDLTFTASQIKNLAQDQTVYTWGVEDGRDNPIKLTMAEYYARYVYNQDYTQATEIGIDRVMTGGNALENLSDAYPGCRYVDFSFPSADPVNDGMDWTSLKLVFQPGEENWYLVGVVHGEWTI